MLKIMMLRKRYDMLQKEAEGLRAKQTGFAKREEDLAAQVEAAETDAEVQAAADAVAELEATVKSTKERLETIKEECDALLAEIDAAEAAAEDAAAGAEGEESEERSRRHRSRETSRQKRARELARTNHVRYEDPRSLLRAALTTSGVVGPAGVDGINDGANLTISSILDLIKVTDCTGMSTYKVAYMSAHSTAAGFTEGTAATESEPTFGSVTFTPASYALLSYVSKDVVKQTPLQYESKVQESARVALRKKAISALIPKIQASNLNETLALIAAGANGGAALLDANFLSNLILAYGGDEGVLGAGYLFLNKKDLKALAAVRGTSEFLPVYNILPDPGNPNVGTIKDNNGLSCRYCLCADVDPLSATTLTQTAKKFMFYGAPACAEMAIWGGVDIDVSKDYKFGEGLLSIMGEVTCDFNVTVPAGFVQVTAKY